MSTSVQVHIGFSNATIISPLLRCTVQTSVPGRQLAPTVHIVKSEDHLAVYSSRFLLTRCEPKQRYHEILLHYVPTLASTGMQQYVISPIPDHAGDVAVSPRDFLVMYLIIRCFCVVQRFQVSVTPST